MSKQHIERRIAHYEQIMKRFVAQQAFVQADMARQSVATLRARLSGSLSGHIKLQ